MDSIYDVSETGIIVVDMQADFTQLKDGALAVEGTGKAYLEKIKQVTKAFKAKGYPIFATQDFHPPNHISFYTNHSGKVPFDIIETDGHQQVLWPPHCIQETENARILLDQDMFNSIVRKGMDLKFDSYSGFFDDGGSATGMDDILKSYNIKNLIIYGLALDYCVKYTALDAVKLGYNVCVMPDLCKSVAEETSSLAVKEMSSVGIVFASDNLFQQR